jgi:hypothetical protein
MRRTDDELQHRWWHRLFKVVRGILVLLSAISAVWLAGVVVFNDSTTTVERITLPQWAGNALQATPGRQVISPSGFLAAPRGEQIGCANAGTITEIDVARLIDTASQCTLLDANGAVLIAGLEKSFPRHRVHADDSAVCLVRGDVCAEGTIVRYGYERAYTVSDAATLILIPALTPLFTIALLNFVYYRLVMYVVFGPSHDLPAA